MAWDHHRHGDEDGLGLFRGMLSALTIMLLAAFVALGAWLFFDAWAATGPGCPGDPAWLGYCDEVAP